MKFKALLLMCCAFIFAPLTNAESSTVNEPIILKYLESWSTSDAEKRGAMLAEIWNAEGYHQSPQSHSVGIEAIDAEIAGFQEYLPGGKVLATDLLKTGPHLTFKFELYGPDDKLVVKGVDYMELDSEGKILKVIGFY